MIEQLAAPVQDPSYIAANLAASQEWLPTHELGDERGVVYPVFTVNDTAVIFRNRNEFPELSVPYHEVADGSSVRPFKPYGRVDPSEKFDAYLQAQSSGENALEVVPNTPLGLVVAAIELGGTDPALSELQDEIAQKKYSEKGLLLLDSIAAATMIGPDGNFQKYFDSDGYALVLSSLAGNHDARAALRDRLESYRDIRAQDTAVALEKNAQSFAAQAAYYEGVEALDPEHLVLVHSTSHAVETAPEGSAILYPASAKRDDEWPRPSLHFTVNAEVTSHVGGSWDHSNSLIITNLKKAIERNGVPHTACDVDTFFNVNPGDSLQLPDPTILTSRSEGELITTEGNTVTYAHKDKYTEDEMQTLNIMANQLGFKTEDSDSPALLLRKIALWQAISGQGADELVTAGAHYVQDEGFQKSFYKMAHELGGVRNFGLHANTVESSLPNAMASKQIDGSFTEFDPAFGDPVTNYRLASDAAIRTVIAAGYAPARPVQQSPDKRAARLVNSLF
ncbi:hypothetical protein H7Y63_01040 [Polaromonas sp.]|nr:hypothetical protein [Candidatus Saccharibacteria bacterium]